MQQRMGTVNDLERHCWKAKVKVYCSQNMVKRGLEQCQLIDEHSNGEVQRNLENLKVCDNKAGQQPSSNDW